MSAIPRAGSARRLLAFGLLLLAVEAANAVCPSQVPADGASRQPSATGHEDAVIRAIHIENGDVFDLNDPQYDGFIHRFMNAVHVQTDASVIRRQLLFSEGDAVSANAISETERYLRANRYLAQAEVSKVNCNAGYVDVRVKTVDAWSLVPSVSFSRKGGRNFGGIEIQETNLLGTGTELKVFYRSKIERDVAGIHFADRQIGSSRVGIGIVAEDNSDGSQYALNLERPFYSLDARRAGGVRIETFEQLDPIYELGEQRADIRHDAHRAEAYYGWSRGLQSGRSIRWTAGIGYDEHRFLPVSLLPVPLELPSNRREVYPFAGVEWLQDRYEKTRNADQMSIVEDRHMGTRVALKLGYATTAIGSMHNAWLMTLEASRGFRPAPVDTVLLRSALEWRQPSGGDSSHRLQSDVRYYHRQSPKRLFFAHLAAVTGDNFDTDRQPGLGSDNGLRAYPVRYQNGDASALLTLEQRFFSDWYPFGLYRIGAAVFFDAGRVWERRGVEVLGEGVLKDAGVGMRIGSPHSSSGRMMHIDLAYAMDGPADIRGWEIYIASRTSF